MRNESPTILSPLGNVNGVETDANELGVENRYLPVPRYRILSE